MYVTYHAELQMEARLGRPLMQSIADHLEAVAGQPGTTGYVVRYLDAPAWADDGSNGTVVWAVASDGAVETVYIRRAEQGPPPGMDNVFDLVTG